MCIDGSLESLKILFKQFKNSMNRFFDLKKNEKEKI